MKRGEQIPADAAMQMVAHIGITRIDTYRNREEIHLKRGAIIIHLHSGKNCKWELNNEGYQK